MMDIEIFESPIIDEGKQVGTLLIIRGIIPGKADTGGFLKWFKANVQEIADNKFKAGYIVSYPDDPNYLMAVILQGVSDFSFKKYQC